MSESVGQRAKEGVMDPARLAGRLVVQPVGHTIDPPARVRKCARFQDRFLGLMFQGQLGRDDGVLLMGLRDSTIDAAIHMLFVNFDLAVFWISSKKVVVDKVLARRWRPMYVPAHPAQYVLELHPERFAEYQIGESIQFVEA